MGRSNDCIHPNGPSVVLYLISSDESGLFLKGQLSFLQSQGFRPVVGTRRGNRSANNRFDAGVEVYDLPFTRNPAVIKDLRALIAVVQLIRRVKPQIVNASTPKAGVLGVLGAWYCRIPHRIYVVRGLRYEGFTGIRRTALKHLERLAMALAHTVIFNSPSLMSVAESDRILPRNRGEVLGVGSSNGIDEARFLGRQSKAEARAALDLQLSNHVIGYVGRLSKSKGIKDLIDIFDLIRSQLPDTRLVIVGDSDLNDPVSQAVIETLEHDPQVLWLPQRSDVEMIYPALDLLIFPSYREGLPNVPLEAQLCEVPVIAYGATGTLDAVWDQKSGILVPTGDVERAGSAAVELLKCDEVRKEMGKFGSAWVSENFKQQKFWERILEVYRRV